MKMKLDANRMMWPEGVYRIAEVCCGNMRALLWESEDGCEFEMYRHDPATGDVSRTLRPEDVEYAVKVAAIVAATLHAYLDGELSDDLGCLSHCLSRTLGLEINLYPIRPEMTQ